MGAQELDETAPLIPQQAAAPQPVAVVLADVAPRAWRGSLLNCCAGCNAHGWGSCLLGYFAPCIAFGQNMKRALSLSAVAQATLYFLLFLGGRAVYIGTSHAVALACPAPMHDHRHGHHGHHIHHGHHDFHKDRQPALIDGLQTSPLPGSHNSSNPGHHHMPPPPMTPECHQALAVMGTVYCVTALLLVFGVIYAARRRTEIREKFGIAGSRFGDLCTWCWCGPCALCQETRTIWANNVRHGVWYGQTQLLTAVLEYDPPTVNKMEAYKPVVAKDFV